MLTLTDEALSQAQMPQPSSAWPTVATKRWEKVFLFLGQTAEGVPHSEQKREVGMMLALHFPQLFVLNAMIAFWRM